MIVANQVGPEEPPLLLGGLSRSRQFGLLFFLVIVPALLVLVGVVAAASQDQSKIRTVTLIEASQSRSVPTSAGSVAEFFQRLQLTIHPNDIVHPGLDSQFNDDDPVIALKRSRPVRIVSHQSGSRVVRTALDDPMAIVLEAGYQLAPGDQAQWLPTTLSRPQDVIILPTIQIVDGHSYRLDFGFGRPMTIVADSNVVGEILAEVNLKLDSSYRIYPDYDQTIEPGNQITIAVAPNRIEHKFISGQVQSQRRYNPDLKKFDERQVQAGRAPIEVLVYRVLVSGDRSQRQLVDRQLVDPGQPEIIEYGLKSGSGISPSYVIPKNQRQDLMTRAGIAQSDWFYVDKIVSKESSWRPGVKNAKSSAYGLCQALPGHKMAETGGGPDWRTNPVTQLRWCNYYAKIRYGGWATSWSAWQSKRWW